MTTKTRKRPPEHAKDADRLQSRRLSLSLSSWSTLVVSMEPPLLGLKHAVPRLHQKVDDILRTVCYCLRICIELFQAWFVLNYLGDCFPSFTRFPSMIFDRRFGDFCKYRKVHVIRHMVRTTHLFQVVLASVCDRNCGNCRIELILKEITLPGSDIEPIC
jgi:hypothetical protein